MDNIRILLELDDDYYYYYYNDEIKSENFFCTFDNFSLDWYTCVLRVTYWLSWEKSWWYIYHHQRLCVIIIRRKYYHHDHDKCLNVNIIINLMKEEKLWVQSNWKNRKFHFKKKKRNKIIQKLHVIVWVFFQFNLSTQWSRSSNPFPLSTMKIDWERRRLKSLPIFLCIFKSESAFLS